jgi:hypothetical protein
MSVHRILSSMNGHQVYSYQVFCYCTIISSTPTYLGIKLGHSKKLDMSTPDVRSSKIGAVKVIEQVMECSHSWSYCTIISSTPTYLGIKLGLLLSPWTPVILLSTYNQDRSRKSYRTSNGV